MMTGIEAMIELLAEFGVRHVFGNPGTTELPLNDRLVTDRRLQYVLGLQEVPVMAMADGYAMASGSIGVTNVHICCGLGNAMGMLYNAYREGTPLLVTAGQQDRRLAFEEPILGGAMTDVARPWTKWAVEVRRVEEIPSAIRRAVQCALTPPRGPVFLALPIDVQMESSDQLDLTPIRLPDTRVRPPTDAVERAVAVLREARNPAILAGSRVTERGAMSELVALAERLGAPVLSESGTTHGRLAFPSRHELNGQGLPLWSPDVRERLAEYDVVLVTGMDLLRQYVYHEPSRAIPEPIRLVHLDEDPWQLGKNFPVEVGVIGDTRESLREVADAWDRTATVDELERARARRARHAVRHAESRVRLEAAIGAELRERPMTPLACMGTIARVIPDDIAVVEEAVTTTNTTLERLGALGNTTGYFGHRGWALGWGLGCAIGVKLAWPDRPVLALLGDGAALYGAAGLWSAARYRLPVAFVICNNAQYQILKVGARQLGLPNARDERFESLEIRDPEVDWVALSRSFGVEAVRMEEPDRLADCLRDAWKRDTPLLIDVPLRREAPPRLNYG
ncbi:MAG: thiamine pyrophosphate-binding protein [Planctomycetes bacterium]|nr:thiamine pyrophosphate-binding protein [Planctomycetota bacterium]